MCRDDDDHNDNDTDHRTGGLSLGENSRSRPRQLYHIYSSINPINEDGIIGIGRSLQFSLAVNLLFVGHNVGG